MKKLTEAQLAKYRQRVAALRARGPRRFIVHWGVLGFGVPWSVAMALSFAYLDMYIAPFLPPVVPKWICWLLVMLPFGLLAGVIFGKLMWREIERGNWFLPTNAEEQLE